MERLVESMHRNALLHVAEFLLHVCCRPLSSAPCAAKVETHPLVRGLDDPSRLSARTEEATRRRC